MSGECESVDGPKVISFKYKSNFAWSLGEPWITTVPTKVSISRTDLVVSSKFTTAAKSSLLLN